MDRSSDLRYNPLVIIGRHDYNRTAEGIDCGMTMESTELSTPSQQCRCTVIEIDEVHRCYLAAAIIRFNALHAGTSVTVSDQITLFDDGTSLVDALIADFYHCLYREKVYSETLPLRRALISGVLGR